MGSMRFTTCCNSGSSFGLRVGQCGWDGCNMRQLDTRLCVASGSCSTRNFESARSPVEPADRETSLSSVNQVQSPRARNFQYSQRKLPVLSEVDRERISSCVNFLETFASPTSNLCLRFDLFRLRVAGNCLRGWLAQGQLGGQRYCDQHRSFDEGSRRYPLPSSNHPPD
jgi:hypothetical protein